MVIDSPGETRARNSYAEIEGILFSFQLLHPYTLRINNKKSTRRTRIVAHSTKQSARTAASKSALSEVDLPSTGRKIHYIARINSAALRITREILGSPASPMIPRMAQPAC